MTCNIGTIDRDQVNRLFEELEQKGKVILHRGKIKLQ